MLRVQVLPPRMLQRADARMYEVKEEYYSRHPEYVWHQKPV